MEKHDPKKIHFKYVFKKKYNPKYVNGVYGSLNNKCEIALNFFLERGPIPRCVKQDVNIDGTLGTPEFKPSNFPDTVVRYVSQGILLNIESAEQVREFLDNMIQQAKIIEEQKNATKDNNKQ